MSSIAKMANWRDEVLLEGDFSIPSKKRTIFKVTLIPGGLFYSQISTISTQYEEKSLQISDVIGCHCRDCGSIANTKTDSSTASFTVFAYPFRMKMFSGRKTRHRQFVTFEVTGSATEEENKKIAVKWKNVINCLARGLHVKPSDVEICQPPPWGTFLILVNPHSGPGKAMHIFKNEIEPMFREASIPFRVIVTEYAGHAYDLIQKLELSDWSAVIIVSGDGLIYEVINGLMRRVDWTSAIKKPIGCLPGGSGNALACSINYAAGEPILPNAVLHSTFVLIKHRVVPMDLVLLQTPSQLYYSFLSITWGIVADIDFESEKYRKIGEARFTLGAIKRIVNLRSYSGKLSFLPVAEYTPKSATAPRTLKKVRRFSLRSMSSSLSSVDSIESKNSKSSSVVLTGARSRSSTPLLGDQLRSVTMSGDASLTVAEQNGSELESISPAKSALNHWYEGDRNKSSNAELKASPALSRVSSAVLEITSSIEINSTVTQNADQSYFLNLNKSDSGTDVLANGIMPATSITNNNCRHEKTVSMTTSKNGDFEQDIVYAAKKDGQAVPTPFLPPLDQPVPDNWVVIEGKFILACAVYQTHLGSDMLAAPSARLADGIIHLMFIREGITRNHLLNLFLSFSDGAHVDSPDVEIVPVLAFRLEPDQNSGNIMIDGERLDPVPVQGHVLPGLARVMAIQ